MTLIQTQIGVFLGFLVNQGWTIEQAKVEGDIIAAQIAKGWNYEAPRAYIRLNRKGAIVKTNRETRTTMHGSWRKALDHGHYTFLVHEEEKNRGYRKLV